MNVSNGSLSLLAITTRRVTTSSSTSSRVRSKGRDKCVIDVFAVVSRYLSTFELGMELGVILKNGLIAHALLGKTLQMMEGGL